MSILNIGTRALQANQVALQTAGNNIANVNTPGYSRQTVVMQTVEGQFTGSGYIGKGVDVTTIKRNFSAFLTRQSTLASSTQAADTVRADYVKQLEGLFPGGASGLGASVNDMLNAFSDVASAPTDITARTVVLTRSRYSRWITIHVLRIKLILNSQTAAADRSALFPTVSMKICSSEGSISSNRFTRTRCAASRNSSCASAPARSRTST